MTVPTQRELMTQGIPAVFQNVRMDPAFAQSKVDASDISAGIGSAFSVVSIRGKVFRIKYRGEEYPVVTPGTAHPAPNVDVVIVKASPAISKIWYEAAFAEGSREAPDCFSTNGVAPDASSNKKQSQFCATCPQNAWGSKTLNGKALKACQDTKRLAVVPLGDLKNESFGGPMLLRVPPASLQDLSHYADQMVQWGHTYFSVGTQLSFDIDAAHPKLNFAPLHPLTGEQAKIIVDLQDHPQVKRMLSEAVEYAKAEDPAQPPQPPGPPPMQASAPPPPPATPQSTAQPQQTYTPPAVPPVSSLAVAMPGPDPNPIPEHLRRPTPAVVTGLTPPPPPPPVADYQYTPDRKFRWKAGMAAWEPVPEAAPLAVSTIAQPVPPAPATAPNGQTVNPADEIARLQAELAAAKAAPAPRTRRKATPPPSPAPTAIVAGSAPAQAPPAPPPPPAASAAPATGLAVSTTPVPDAPPPPPAAAAADVNAQLDGLLNTILPPSGS